MASSRAFFAPLPLSLRPYLSAMSLIAPWMWSQALTGRGASVMAACVCLCCACLPVACLFSRAVAWREGRNVRVGGSAATDVLMSLLMSLLLCVWCVVARERGRGGRGGRKIEARSARGTTQRGWRAWRVWRGMTGRRAWDEAKEPQKGVSRGRALNDRAEIPFSSTPKIVIRSLFSHPDQLPLPSSFPPTLIRRSTPIPFFNTFHTLIRRSTLTPFFIPSHSDQGVNSSEDFSQ